MIRGPAAEGPAPNGEEALLQPGRLGTCHVTEAAKPPATLPHCLLRNAARTPRRPAFREKRRGIWHTLSWADYAGLVRRIASGLAAQGFGCGSRLAVWGENRACLYAATLAAQALGGAGVPLHPDAEMGRIVQILRDSRASVAMVGDWVQAEKLLAARDLLPDLRRVVALDPRGSADAAAMLQTFAAFEQAGRAHAAERPGMIDAGIAERRSEETALLLFPWQAHQLPRPLVLSHAKLLAAASAIVSAEDIRPDDDTLCYLPLCSIEDAVYSQALGLLVGFARNCPEGPDTVPRDMREIAPTIMFAPPTVVAALAVQIDSRALSASPLKRRLFARFCASAEAAGRAQRPAPPLRHRLTGAAWELLIRAPVRDQLGLRRARWVHLGEGPLLTALASRFSALGVPLRRAPAILPAPRPPEATAHG